MKKYILLLFILLTSTLLQKVQAQKNVQAQIDSLEGVLKISTRDTGKVSTLLKLCSVYQQTNPNKVGAYLDEATQIANDFKSNKHIAECLYSKGLNEYGKGNFSAAKKKYQEALALFELEKNQAKMATMIYNIGIQEVYTGNYAKANESFFRALKIYEILDKKDLMSNSYSAIGNVYGRQGNSKKEEEFHLKSLQLRLKLDDSYGVAASYINIKKSN